MASAKPAMGRPCPVIEQGNSPNKTDSDDGAAPWLKPGAASRQPNDRKLRLATGKVTGAEALQTGTSYCQQSPTRLSPAPRTPLLPRLNSTQSPLACLSLARAVAIKQLVRPCSAQGRTSIS